MTEPDRSAELEEYPDYFLQTEDYSSMYRALEELDEEHFSSRSSSSSDFMIESYRHLNSEIDTSKRYSPLFLPIVAWEHHHHATVGLVHGLRRKVDSSNNDVVIDATVSSPIKQETQEKNKLSPNNETGNKAKKNPVAMLWDSIVNRPKLVSECSEWKRLQKHAEHMKTQHLRDLLQDKERSDFMHATYDGVYLDYSRQCVTGTTMKFLFELAKKQNLAEQIQAMIRGDKINFTEKRAVLHTALRSGKEEIGTVIVDGMDVIQEVHEVLDQIKEFTNGVRSGIIVGYTGKRLRNIVSVGIGGSYLGPEFLHECLKTEPEGVNSALGYR